MSSQQQHQHQNLTDGSAALPHHEHSWTSSTSSTECTQAPECSGFAGLQKPLPNGQTADMQGLQAAMLPTVVHSSIHVRDSIPYLLEGQALHHLPLTHQQQQGVPRQQSLDHGKHELQQQHHNLLVQQLKMLQVQMQQFAAHNQQLLKGRPENLQLQLEHDYLQSVGNFNQLLQQQPGLVGHQQKAQQMQHKAHQAKGHQQLSSPVKPAAAQSRSQLLTKTQLHRAGHKLQHQQQEEQTTAAAAAADLHIKQQPPSPVQDQQQQHQYGLTGVKAAATEALVQQPTGQELASLLQELQQQHMDVMTQLRKLQHEECSLLQRKLQCDRCISLLQQHFLNHQQQQQQRQQQQRRQPATDRHMKQSLLAQVAAVETACHGLKALLGGTNSSGTQSKAVTVRESALAACYSPAIDQGDSSSLPAAAAAGCGGLEAVGSAPVLAKYTANSSSSSNNCNPGAPSAAAAPAQSRYRGGSASGNALGAAAAAARSGGLKSRRLLKPRPPSSPAAGGGWEGCGTAAASSSCNTNSGPGGSTSADSSTCSISSKSRASTGASTVAYGSTGAHLNMRYMRSNPIYSAAGQASSSRSTLVDHRDVLTVTEQQQQVSRQPHGVAVQQQQQHSACAATPGGACTGNRHALGYWAGAEVQIEASAVAEAAAASVVAASAVAAVTPAHVLTVHSSSSKSGSKSACWSSSRKAHHTAGWIAQQQQQQDVSHSLLQAGLCCSANGALLPHLPCSTKDQTAANIAPAWQRLNTTSKQLQQQMCPSRGCTVVNIHSQQQQQQVHEKHQHAPSAGLCSRYVESFEQRESHHTPLVRTLLPALSETNASPVAPPTVESLRQLEQHLEQQQHHQQVGILGQQVECSQLTWSASFRSSQCGSDGASTYFYSVHTAAASSSDIGRNSCRYSNVWEGLAQDTLLPENARASLSAAAAGAVDGDTGTIGEVLDSRQALLALAGVEDKESLLAVMTATAAAAGVRGMTCGVAARVPKPNVTGTELTAPIA